MKHSQLGDAIGMQSSVHLDEGLGFEDEYSGLGVTGSGFGVEGLVFRFRV